MLDGFRYAAYLEVVDRFDHAAIEHSQIGGAGPTLSYEIVGPTNLSFTNAVTLLCLHGNSSHRGVWRLVARELREFRCVLLDLRGHGDSEHVSPPAYNPEHHAEDLAQVVSKLAHGPYVLLAHSAGALAAALEKLSAASEPTRSITTGAAHLCIVDPASNKFSEREGVLGDIFASHPPIAQRVIRLKGMAYQQAKRESPPAAAAS